jgi:hypothetical protein
VAQQNILVGTTVNDGTGDPLRTAFVKTQNNFSDLYTNYVSNAQLIANLTGYVTTSSLSGNIALYSSNNSSYLGGVAAASYQLNSTLNANISSYLPSYGGALNATSISIGSNVTVNTSGLYTGNSVDLTTGTGATVANDTIIFIGNNGSNSYLTTGTLSVNAVTIANTTGVYTGTVNAASHTVGTSTIANSTGVFTSIVNGASITVGTTVVANSTGIVTPTATIGTSTIANSTGVYTGTVNAASHTVGTSTIANSTGVYTGTVNAASHTVGTSSVVNATGIWTTGVVNGSSYSIGTLFVANTAGVYTGLVNTAVISIGNSSVNTYMNSSSINMYANAGMVPSQLYIFNSTIASTPSYVLATGVGSIAVTAIANGTLGTGIYAYAPTLGSVAGQFVSGPSGNGITATSTNGYGVWAQSNGSAIYAIAGNTTANIITLAISTGAVVMNMFGNGNIGLGNTAPVDRLSISGAIHTTGYVNSFSHISGSYGSATGGFVGNTTFVGVGNSTVNAVLSTTKLTVGGLIDSNTSKVTILPNTQFGGSISANSNIIITRPDGRLVFQDAGYVSNANEMYIARSTVSGLNHIEFSSANSATNYFRYNDYGVYAFSSNGNITLTVGNNTVNTVSNGSAISVGSSFIANATGVYTTGVVNSAGISTTGVFNIASANVLSQVLTDGATVSWNIALGQIATVTLAGNRTMAAPTNLKVGRYVLYVKQDAVGTRLMTWNSVFKWANGTAPTLTTNANATDVLRFDSDGTNLYAGYNTLNVK